MPITPPEKPSAADAAAKLNKWIRPGISSDSSNYLPTSYLGKAAGAIGEEPPAPTYAQQALGMPGGKFVNQMGGAFPHLPQVTQTPSAPVQAPTGPAYQTPTLNTPAPPAAPNPQPGDYVMPRIQEEAKALKPLSIGEMSAWQKQQKTTTVDRYKTAQDIRSGKVRATDLTADQVPWDQLLGQPMYGQVAAIGLRDPEKAYNYLRELQQGLASEGGARDLTAPTFATGLSQGITQGGSLGFAGGNEPGRTGTEETGRKIGEFVGQLVPFLLTGGTTGAGAGKVVGEATKDMAPWASRFLTAAARGIGTFAPIAAARQGIKAFQKPTEFDLAQATSSFLTETATGAVFDLAGEFLGKPVEKLVESGIAKKYGKAAVDTALARALTAGARGVTVGTSTAFASTIKDMVTGKVTLADAAARIGNDAVFFGVLDALMGAIGGPEEQPKSGGQEQRQRESQHSKNFGKTQPMRPLTPYEFMEGTRDPIKEGFREFMPGAGIYVKLENGVEQRLFAMTKTSDGQLRARYDIWKESRKSAASGQPAQATPAEANVQPGQPASTGEQITEPRLLGSGQREPGAIVPEPTATPAPITGGTPAPPVIPSKPEDWHDIIQATAQAANHTPTPEAVQAIADRIAKGEMQATPTEIMKALVQPQPQVTPSPSSSLPAPKVDILKFATYEEAQTAIDDFEETLVKKYGEREVANYDWAPELRQRMGMPAQSPFTTEERTKLNALYEARDKIGKSDDEAALSSVLKNVPDQGPATKTMVETALRKMMRENNLWQATGSATEQNPEDFAHRLYVTLSHSLASKGQLPQDFAGDLELAVRVARDFRNSEYGQSPEPLLRQVTSITKTILGDAPDFGLGPERVVRNVGPETSTGQATSPPDQIEGPHVIPSDQGQSEPAPHTKEPKATKTPVTNGRELSVPDINDGVRKLWNAFQSWREAGRTKDEPGRKAATARMDEQARKLGFSDLAEMSHAALDNNMLTEYERPEDLAADITDYWWKQRQQVDQSETASPGAPPTEYTKEPIAESAKKIWQMTAKEFEDILYPRAGNVVDGRTVRDHIPNRDSISASMHEYKILSGIREVPISLFDPEYVPETTEKVRKLADEVAQSNEINPLIVAVDEEGPYILEGGHRYDALRMLNAKSLPALVVLESDPHLAAVKKALSEGKPVPPEVLKDYPSLQPKDSQEPTKEPTPQPNQAPENSMPAPMLGEDPKTVNPADFDAYTKRIGKLIDTFASRIKDGTLPQGDRVQPQLRNIAAEVLRRIPGEDEWSDALEAAVQKVAREHRTADPNMDLGDRIRMGQALETYLKNAGRSLEKTERQQFSSPIPVAESVHYAADIRPGETVKEGSAGTGSLLEPFQGDGVKLKAVELSPRRAAILKAMGFDVRNGDTFKAVIKADVAVGNPPFRGANLGVKGTQYIPPWGKSSKDIGDQGNRFFLWDLNSTVPDGGRVVHVTSPGVVDPTNSINGPFRTWLGEKHTIRAMILFPPQAYETRGVTEATGKQNTSFAKSAAGLLVVDKGKIPNAPPPIIAQPQTWDEFMDLIKPLAGGGTHARIAHVDEGGRTEPIPEPASGVGSPAEGGGVRGQPSEGAGGTPSEGPSDVAQGERGGQPGPGAAGGGRRVASGLRGAGKRENPPAGTNAGGGGTPAGAERGTPDVGQPEGVTPPGEGAVQPEVAETPTTGGGNQSEGVPELATVEPGKGAESGVPNALVYVPERISGRAHPGKVIEPPALAYAERPNWIEIDPNNTPHESLVNAVGPKGYGLSDVQLEIASAAHGLWNSGKSLLLADDTGVGKTGTILALAADGERKGLFKRTLIVTIADQVAKDNFGGDNSEFGINLPFTIVGPSSNLQNLPQGQKSFAVDDSKDEYIFDASRAQAMRENGNLKGLQEYMDRTKRYQPFAVGDGTIIMSINTFGDTQKAVLRWLQESKGDVRIIYDEAHLVKNVDGSQRGMAALQLYKELGDKAQTLYSTATAAESLDDYEFMYGLGLWNPDTWGEFKMRLMGYSQGSASGGKQTGGKQNQLARRISARKSAFKREIPLAMMEQIVRELKRNGQYYGRAQSLEGVELVPLPITMTAEQAAQWDNAVKFIKLVAEKADEHSEKITGRALIIAQVVGYMRRLRGYFMMDPVIDYINKAKAEAEARGEKIKFVISGDFKSGDDGKPANLMAAIGQINDKVRTKEPDGSVSYDDLPEAIYDKETLRAILRGENEDWGPHPVPDIPSPVDRIYQAFGENRVAVINGDVKPDERTANRKAFQGDSKDVIYITKAGSTGINLHDITGNRVHFIHLDYDYDAKSTKQREGRVNRTGQLTPPVFVYPHSLTGLDAKFVGTILARYQAMGALSRGSTSQLGGNDLGGFDFTGPLAEKAVYQLVGNLDPEIRAQMFGEPYRDIDPNDESTLRTALGGGSDVVKRLLNSMMFLEWDKSGEVFEQFVDAVNAVKDQAEREGGVLDQFQTYTGRELDVREAEGGLKLRRIQTILSDQQKKAIEHERTRAEEVLAKARAAMDRAKPTLREDSAGQLQRRQADLQKARTDSDAVITDARQLHAKFIRHEQGVTWEQVERARKKAEDALARIEQITRIVDSLRTRIQGLDQDNRDVMRTLGPIQPQLRALERAEAMLKTAQTSAQTNDVVMLVDGNIVTTGMMVTIRDAIRSAGGGDPKVELRGYQLEDGRKVVGAIIPEYAEGAVARALNARGSVSKLIQSGNVDSLWTHVQSGNELSVEGGFTLRWDNGAKAIRIGGMKRSDDTHRQIFAQQNNRHPESIAFDPVKQAFFIKDKAGLQVFLQRFPPVTQTGGKSGDSHMGAPAPFKPQAKEKPSTDRLPLTTRLKVLQQVAKLIAPVHTGRYPFGLTKSIGVFKGFAHVIRTKRAEDLLTIAHEVGHALDKWLGFSQSGTYDKELTALAEALYGKEMLKDKPLMYKRREGVAEFGRRYLTEPDSLDVLAPKFKEAFDKAMEANPEIGKAVGILQKTYQDYYDQNPALRGMASISFSSSPSEPMTWDRIKSEVKLMADTFYRNWVEELAPLGIHEATLQRAMAARGWMGIAETFLEQGQVQANGTVSGKSLKEILKPVLKDEAAHMEFSTYVAARRVLYLHETRGWGDDKFPMTVEEATDAVLKFGSKEFNAALTDLQDWQDSVLQFYTRSGMLSDEQYIAAKEANEVYVPFRRVGTEPEMRGGRGVSGKRFVDLSQAVRVMKGGTGTIVDPVESMVRNAYSMIHLAERNAVGVTLADFADTTPDMGYVIEKLPPDMQAIRLDVDEIVKVLRRIGLDEEEIKNARERLKDMLRMQKLQKNLNENGTLTPEERKEYKELATKQLQSDMDLSAKVTLFRALTFPTGKGKASGELAIWRNGQPVIYQVKDEAVYRALQMLDQESATSLVRMLRPVAQWLRLSATSTAEFILRNLGRDTWGSAVFGRGLPGESLLRGLMHVLSGKEVRVLGPLAEKLGGNPDFYNEWLANRGGYSSFLSVDREYSQTRVKELVGQVKWYKTVWNPLVLLRVASEIVESAPKVGEYELARKGIDRITGQMGLGDTTPQSRYKAGKESRKPNLDFNRAGSMARTYNQVAAFFSAGVQDLDQFYQEFLRPDKNPKRVLRNWVRALLFLTLPTLLLAGLNRNNDAYKKLPQWRRDLFWNVPLDWVGLKGHFAPIPIPHLLGLVFKVVPERFMRVGSEGSTAFSGFGTAAVGIAVPNVIPTLLSLLAEMRFNVNMFTGAPIVPKGEEKLDPELQYGPETSATAKLMGKLFNLSPRMLEQGAKDLFGGWAGHVMDVTDIPVKLATGESLAGSRIPFLSRLGSTVVMSPAEKNTESIGEFYDRYDQMNNVWASAPRRADVYKPLGDYETWTSDEKARFAKVFNKLNPDEKALIQQATEIRKVANKLSELRKQLLVVETSKTMTPENKTKWIAFIRKQMDTQAAQNNAKYAKAGKR